MESRNYDAIVVGSGLGGLSCAAYLAKHGQKVLVLEKHSTPGGYASSFKRGEYVFDSCLHMIGGVGNGQKSRRFFELCGVAENVEFLKIKYAMRLVFPEHDIRLPSGDIKAVISVLGNAFPEEREGLRQLFDEMHRIKEDVYKLLFSDAPMWQQMLVFPFRYKSLFSMLKKTTGQLLDKYLRDAKLKAIVLGNWGFFGLPPNKVNALAAVGNFTYWNDGSYYPKGGNQVIPDAFVGVINQNGGEVILNSEVVSILTENGRAVGVRTKNGEKYLAKNIVSNASAPTTFHNLVGDRNLPLGFVKRMDEMELSTSGFIMYLGLDDGFAATLNNSEDYDNVIFETYDLDKDHEWILNHDVEKASFFVTLYSNVDRSIAKGNRFIVSMIQGQPYSYWKQFEAGYEAGNKEEYNKEKDRVASVLIKRAEKIIPGLSKHIETIETATPLTLKRYTGNSNGAFYGWANNVKQFTPMDRMAKTPVKNLYLSSAWTFPGEGQTITVACGCRLGRKLVGE